MNLTLADKFTFSRLVLLPFVVVLFYADFTGHYLWCAFIFSIITLTDYLDGYLARRMGEVSEFGAFLDPVMDKLSVVTALVLLVSRYSSWWFVLLVILITAREIAVSALREYMASKQMRQKIAVYFISKCKTVFQCLAIIVLIFSCVPWVSPWFSWLGVGLLVSATLLSLWTLIAYLQVVYNVLAS